MCACVVLRPRGRALVQTSTNSGVSEIQTLPRSRSSFASASFRPETKKNRTFVLISIFFEFRSDSKDGFRNHFGRLPGRRLPDLPVGVCLGRPLQPLQPVHAEQPRLRGPRRKLRPRAFRGRRQKFRRGKLRFKLCSSWGPHSIMDSVLASHPAVLGSIFGIP